LRSFFVGRVEFEYVRTYPPTHVDKFCSSHKNDGVRDVVVVGVVLDVGRPRPKQQEQQQHHVQVVQEAAAAWWRCQALGSR